MSKSIVPSSSPWRRRGWRALSSVLCAAVCLLAWSSDLSAAGTTAVVIVDIEGATPEASRVDLVVDALSAGQGYVMTPQETSARLGAAGAVVGDTTTRDIVSQIQKGVDSYYDADVAEAERQLAEGIERALSQPLLLTVDPSRSESARQGLMVLPRVLAQSGQFDEAQAMTKRMVEVFPTYVPSQKKHPPDVISKVEDARGQLVSEGRRLTLRQTVPGEACLVSINGLDVLLQGEREVYVAAQDYGIGASCGEDGQMVGPWLVNTSRASQQLPVSSVLLASLAPAQTGKAVTLPSGFAPRADLGTLLTTLLDVDSVVLIGARGDDVLAVRVQRDGTAVQATRGSLDSAGEANELVRALERRSPVGAVAVDTGTGFEVAESPSYVGEYVALGVGGATMIAGAVFLGIASSQLTVVEDCQAPGACRESTTTDNNDLYATDLFVGQLLMGVGAAIAVTGGTVWLVRYLTSAPGSDLDEVGVMDGFGVAVGPDGARATWGVTW